MFINILIFISFIPPLLLLAIKYGFLEIMSITLAVVALIPFIISALLFFVSSPKISYQITNKKIQEVDGIYQYEALISIHFKKGNVLVKDIYFSSDTNITKRTPLSDGWSGYVKLEILGLIQETDRVISYKLLQEDKPFFKNLGTGYMLGFESHKKLKDIKIRIAIDSQNDPFKQSVWNIFQPNYNYRQQTDVVSIDFTNLNRQEGEFNNPPKFP